MFWRERRQQFSALKRCTQYKCHALFICLLRFLHTKSHKTSETITIFPQLTLIFCGMEVRLSGILRGHTSWAATWLRKKLELFFLFFLSVLSVVIIRRENKKTLPQASFYNVRDFIILIIPEQNFKQGWFGFVKGITNRWRKYVRLCNQILNILQNCHCRGLPALTLVMEMLDCLRVD